MYYSINVSRNGRHHFATAPHSLTDPTTAREVFDDLVRRFPESEGFLVEVSRAVTTLTRLDWK